MAEEKELSPERPHVTQQERAPAPRIPSELVTSVFCLPRAMNRCGTGCHSCARAWKCGDVEELWVWGRNSESGIRDFFLFLAKRLGFKWKFL